MYKFTFIIGFFVLGFYAEKIHLFKLPLRHTEKGFRKVAAQQCFILPEADCLGSQGLLIEEMEELE